MQRRAACTNYSSRESSHKEERGQEGETEGGVGDGGDGEGSGCARGAGVASERIRARRQQAGAAGLGARASSEGNEYACNGSTSLVHSLAARTAALRPTTPPPRPCNPSVRAWRAIRCGPGRAGGTLRGACSCGSMACDPRRCRPQVPSFTIENFDTENGWDFVTLCDTPSDCSSADR
jgi:hypothetical protein